HTARRNGAFREILAATIDPQSNLAIIDQKLRARFERSKNLGMRQLDAPRIAQGGIKVKAEPVVRFQLVPAIGKRPDAQFRPLTTGRDRTRTSGFRLDLANRGVASAVIVMAAMAHVQTKDIRTGVEQRPDHLLAAGGWAKRGHDFHVAMSSHTEFLAGL